MKHPGGHLLLPLLVFLTILSCNGQAVNLGVFAPSRLEYISGQDGVSSIPFDEDMTLWTFADTIPNLQHTGNKGRENFVMLQNSLAWTEKITSSNVAGIKFNYYMENGNVAQFIKNTKEEDPLHYRLWALDGVRAGNTVYVYYALVHVPQFSKYLEFSVKYIGLAVWEVPPGWKPADGFKFRRTGPLFPEGYPFFGAAAMMKDGYVYLAGHSKKDGAFPVSFARARAEHIADLKSYEYLDSTGEWTADFGRCGYFFGDVAGECSLSFNDYRGKYEMFYAGMFSGEIKNIAFSDFSLIQKADRRTIYRPPLPEKGKMWAYSAKEIFRERNRNFLIYIDPASYQPVLLEYKQ